VLRDEEDTVEDDLELDVEDADEDGACSGVGRRTERPLENVGESIDDAEVDVDVRSEDNLGTVICLGRKANGLVVFRASLGFSCSSSSSRKRKSRPNSSRSYIPELVMRITVVVEKYSLFCSANT
jgi:hypothetical protein